MYRLTNIADDRLQRIISKELMNGFEETFHLKSNNMKAIIEQIEDFCEYIEMPIDTQMQHDYAVYKIIGMFQELADPNFKYTYDEQGEYILAQILEQQLALLEEFIPSNIEDDEITPDLELIESEIAEHWETSLSKDDIKYVKEWADAYFDTLKKEALAEDVSTSDECIAEYDEKKAFFIDRVMYFPLMAYEMHCDVTPEFLFWDSDYLFVEQWGIENFEAIKDFIRLNGSEPGFSGVDEHTQLYTGSAKFELTDN